MSDCYAEFLEWKYRFPLGLYINLAITCHLPVKVLNFLYVLRDHHIVSKISCQCRHLRTFDAVWNSGRVPLLPENLGFYGYYWYRIPPDPSELDSVSSEAAEIRPGE